VTKKDFRGAHLDLHDSRAPLAGDRSMHPAGNVVLSITTAAQHDRLVRSSFSLRANDVRPSTCFRTAACPSESKRHASLSLTSPHNGTAMNRLEANTALRPVWGAPRPDEVSSFDGARDVLDESVEVEIANVALTKRTRQHDGDASSHMKLYS